MNPRRYWLVLFLCACGGDSTNDSGITDVGGTDSGADTASDAEPGADTNDESDAPADVDAADVDAAEISDDDILVADASLDGPVDIDATDEGDSDAVDASEADLDQSEVGDDAATVCPPGAEGCACRPDGACDEGLVCGDDVVCAAPPACEDSGFEPNNNENTAYRVSDIGCPATFTRVPGTLTVGDVDWFYFEWTRTGFCDGHRVSVDIDVPAEVCVYADCLDGTTATIDCSLPAAAALSPMGWAGCCGSGSTVEFNHDCGGLDNDILVRVSVTSDMAVCSDYAVSYGE